MGFYGIDSTYDNKSENTGSCQSTHDQVQPETRYGVSGSNGEAQRQDLLRSSGHFSRGFRDHLQTTKAPELWSCMLGGNRRRRDALRLDHSQPRNPSVHQAGTQDNPSSWVRSMDQFGNLRAGQAGRLAVRYRALHCYSTRRSCPGIGQLNSLIHSGHKQLATGDRQQASSYKLFKKIFHLIPSSD